MSIAAPPLPQLPLAPIPREAAGAAPLPRGHIPALDGVRGLAILAVTLYRFRPGPDEASSACQALHFLLEAGSRGVDLFFVLSGFLVTGILYDTKGREDSLRNFYVRRILRILPLYYGVLLAALVLLPLASQGAPLFQQARDHQAWLWLHGANLAIAWEGEWRLGAFDHFWSLAIEEHFYLVWPLVVFGCSRATSMRMAISLAAASAASRIAWVALGGNGAAADVFTLFRLDGLLIGAWLALAARGPQGIAGLRRLALPVACVSGLLVLPELILHKRLLSIPTSAFALLFGAVVLLAVTARPASLVERFWRQSWLRTLGKYSYAMYVFQSPLIPLAALLFTAESLSQSLGSPLAGRMAYIVLMVALTLLCAWASWHIYEKQFLKLKARFGGAH